MREIRGDIVLDRSAFACPSSNPGDFDGEPLRPYNVRPDALLLNYQSVLLQLHARRGARRRAGRRRAAAGRRARRHAACRWRPAPCDDWRAALKADFSDPARLRFAGSFPAACGEQSWPLAYADPRSYNARLLAGLWREMGGKLGGRVRDGARAGRRRRASSCASPPLAEVVRDINKFSNNVMAQQLFLTLALARARRRARPRPRARCCGAGSRERIGERRPTAR